jgi:hypothetical protein
MVVKKFTYEDGMNLLVPAKCGTRWVDGNTNPTNIIDAIDHREIITIENLVDSKTKMIFRNPHDALISGLHTEYIWFNYTIEELIDRFWKNKMYHCCFDFWEHIYELWDTNPFEFIMQSDLSKLFGFEKGQLNRSLYDSSQMKNYISKDELKQKIGIDELKKMYDVIDIDALWLERMIKNERGLVSQRRFNKVIFENKKIISDLTLKIIDIEKDNKIIINGLKLELLKITESLSISTLQINNLNKKTINNKNEILKCIKILSSIFDVKDRLI